MDGPQLLLHPPSPPRQTSPRQPSDMEEQFVLPPVSTLLRETTPSPPTDNYNNSNVLPSLHLPNKRSPSLQIRDSSEATREPVEMFPPLTLTIPCQSISSCSPCTSPASSPFPYQGHLDTPQTSPSSSPHPGHDQQANHHLLLPPPCNGRRTRSPSNASTSSFSSVSSYPSLPSSPALQRRLSDPPLYSAFDHDPPSTSWQRPQSASPSPSLSPATTPLQFKSPQNTANTTCPAAPVVAKRKRGRPPNALRQVSSRENWTFVTPTVWDVKRGRQVTNVHEVEEKEGNNDTPPVTVVVWPEGSSSGEQSRNNGLNTFTSTKMDSTLSMPKKKRGRKPKMQLEGNSCFVWRDLTARRSTNRSNHKRKSSLSTNARTAAAASSRSNNNDNLASRVETLTLAEKSTL